MLKKILFSLLFTGLPLSTTLAEDASKSSAVQGGVAAIVNDKVVTMQDLDQRMRIIALSMGVEPNKSLSPLVLKHAIEEKLKLQHLQENKFTIKEEEWKAELIAFIRSSNLNSEQFDALLKEKGILKSALNDFFAVKAAWSKYILTQKRHLISITEEEIASELKKNESIFNNDRYVYSEILLPVDDPAREGSVKQDAFNLIEMLKNGQANFRAAANQFSSSPTALKGGSCGLVIASNLSKEIKEALDVMKVGELALHRTIKGYNILWLERKFKAGQDAVDLYKVKTIFIPFNPEQTSFEKLKDAIKQRLDHVNDGKIMEFVGKQLMEERKALYNEINTELDRLHPELQKVILSLSQGTLSEPILLSNSMVAVVMVEGKSRESIKLPSRDDVGNKIFIERLSLIERRLLHELHNSAFVEIKLK